MKKLIFTFVLLLFFISFSSVSFAGKRFGGGFGGRGGFSSFSGGLSRGFSEGGFSRSFSEGGFSRYSGGGYSSGLGGGFIPVPMFIGGSIPWGIIGIVLLLVVVPILVNTIKTRVSGKQRYIEEQAGISFLTIAISGSDRTVQKGLNELSERGGFGDPAREAYLFRDACLILLRALNSVTHCYFQLFPSLKIHEARQKFETLATTARAKLEKEGLRVDIAGRRELREQKEEDFKVGEFVVITLILAFRGLFFNIKEIASIEELKNVLLTLSTVSEETYLGMEVIWDPLNPEYSLTEKEMDVTYPELLPI